MRIPLRLSHQSKVTKLLAAVVIAVVLGGLAVSAAYVWPLSVGIARLDETLYDSLYRLRPAEDRTNSEVIIVVADQKSLDDLKGGKFRNRRIGWPWMRELWGLLANYLGRNGAKAVAFDVLYSEPSVFQSTGNDDGAFAAMIDRTRSPVIFATDASPDGMSGPFAPPVKHPLFGAVNIGDELVYRTYSPKVRGFPSLSSEVVQVTTGHGSPWADPFLLHYYGPYERPDGRTTFRYISAANVIAAAAGQKNPGFDPAIFKDRIVLVGATAYGTFDMKSSPLSAVYPGVEIHATAIENMLNRQRVLVVPRPYQVLAAFVVGLTAAAGVIFPRRGWIKLVSAVVAAVALFAAAIVLFRGRQIYWLPLAAPIFALFTSTVAAFAWSYTTEDRQRRLVLKALSQYVSPEVAARIDRDPESLRLGGEQREMTVMFTDIQGFTDLSERLEVEKLSTMLNFYLGEMSSLILSVNGTLDKYIGDAIMSFWNAPINQPDHATLACRAALAMERREREIQPELRALGAEGLLTRIGINSGPMIVGNMGAAQKFNYTVLGDSVNLGSRLEGANKFYGSRILLAQTTAEQVKSQFVLRQLDVLRVKGKQKPMAVYELMSEAPATEDLRTRVGEYEAGFVLYQQQQWDDAELPLRRLRDRFPDDAPAAALLERIAYLREHPPGKDWDGVYVAKGK